MFVQQKVKKKRRAREREREEVSVKYSAPDGGVVRPCCSASPPHLNKTVNKKYE
jgi:hypothetical protein